MGGGDIIKGTVACISADNPASSALAGFKEGALAHHPCRHCMITSDEMSSKVMISILFYEYIYVHCTDDGR